MNRRALPAAFLALACTAGIPSAGAEEPPAPKVRTLDEDLAQARQMMKDEKWEPASAAIRRAVESRTDSPEVVDRIADIEEDLKLCLYRAQAKSPTAQELFGPCAKSLARMGRKLTLEFPSGPQSPEWKSTPEGVWVLPIRFEGEVALEFKSGLADVVALLHYDPDRQTGYAVWAGRKVDGVVSIGEDIGWSVAGLLRRLDGKREEKLDDGVKMSRVLGTRPVAFRIQCKNQKIDLVVTGSREVGSPPQFQKVEGRWSATDATHKSGIVAFKALATDLVVAGTLEEMSFRALVSAHHAREFKHWVRDSYRRSEVLPAWVLSPRKAVGPTAAAGASGLSAPDGADPADPAVARALASWSRGAMAEFVVLSATVRDAPPGTALLLEGLTMLAIRAPARAESVFGSLIQRFPNYAPGYLYRAIARFHRRDLEGAKTDLDCAWDGTKSNPDLYMLEATLALFGSDLERAHRACDEARRAGAMQPALEHLAGMVRRSLRGPAWVKRYEQKTTVAVITTDHSQELCADANVEISSTLTACGEKFGRKRPAGAPLRVHVFSSREGFLAYAAEAGRDLDSVAGAYIPITNEMVLFVPEVERASLWRTIRHETFHFYVHAFLEEVPVWFDEGYAQWFENGKGKGASLLIRGIEAGRARDLRAAWGKGLTSVKDLMLMDTETFREKAAQHYAQAQALIVLFHEKKSPWTKTLQEYFDSLLAGASREEAFQKHWEPVLKDVEKAYLQFLAEVFKEVDGR